MSFASLPLLSISFGVGSSDGFAPDFGICAALTVSWAPRLGYFPPLWRNVARLEVLIGFGAFGRAFDGTLKMALSKCKPSGDETSVSMAPLPFSKRALEKVNPVGQSMTSMASSFPAGSDVDIDIREIYFLIMHFLSAGPCKRTYGQFWNELLEYHLLPRRYHAWYSRCGAQSGDEDDDGISLPLCYIKLAERYPHIEKDHLVKLLKQLILNSTHLPGMGRGAPSAADVPTLLGSGSFSLLAFLSPSRLGFYIAADRDRGNKGADKLPSYLRWPHMQADQVHGLTLREIGGGFTKHHRAPSIRAACYAIAKPSTLVQKMEIIKKLRGHQNAVYCATFDRSGRYVITGSDDRLVKIWSMETAFCLASCRGHEGDITDLAVSSNNAVVASSANDSIIRVWHLPDGHPISVLKGHTGAVTAIAFSPRPSAVYQLLSSSDDGTCRIWDARQSSTKPRIYIPKPPDTLAGKSTDPTPSVGQQTHQILCCAFNANGTIFVTGSSDTFARVWNACKINTDDSEQQNYEMDLLYGHENDVNYVQFSGCAVGSRSSIGDSSKEDNLPKFKNSWFTHDNLVTCSRDGSAIIWIPRSRRSHGKVGRWTRAYHLKVPPPPMPPQPPRGGPRQRYQPTPRGVNMIVWSLDNRFVLAAIMDFVCDYVQYIRYHAHPVIGVEHLQCTPDRQCCLIGLADTNHNCRICVWNASDGSLVHSLIGHKDSTFVLDVHPFNPRIAMSAGYDGKMIIWDIWEGKPVRIYETGPFKLVDGKFSLDGTSVVLSDEVGQIFIVATGQGESQKDAKYDQFFLGDYRPLMQDTSGNALDQETQLTPHRRNIQDLLCDSDMIPYSEPYQGIYQRRRLGILGIEWRPTSLKLAVGPTYNATTGDFQSLPIGNLEQWVEPSLEVVDAIDWEVENDMQSDDTDSEYNVTDEYLSDGEHESLSNSSSGDAESSAEDSRVDDDLSEGLRRSKRKKHKSEAKFTTLSGRRVKRRSLDKSDGATLSRAHRPRRSRSGCMTGKTSSKSEPLRPQRVAKTNALTFFSKITSVSTDGEDNDSDSNSSESESALPDSKTQSIESERSMKNNQLHYANENEKFKDECEDAAKPSPIIKNQDSQASRRRLVLKLPPGEPTVVVSGSTESICHKQDGVPVSLPITNVDVNYKTADAHGVRQIEIFGHPNLSAHQASTMKWGEVKQRSSKRPRLGDMITDICQDGPRTFVSDNNGRPISENECGTSISRNQAHENDPDRSVLENKVVDDAPVGLSGTRIDVLSPERKSRSLGHQHEQDQVTLTCSDSRNELVVPPSRDPVSSEFWISNVALEGPEVVPIKNENLFGSKCIVDVDQQMEKNVKTIYPKLQIKSGGLAQEVSSSSSKPKSIACNDWRSFEGEILSDSPVPTGHNLESVMNEEDEGTSGKNLEHGQRNNGSESSERQTNASLSISHNYKMDLDSHGKVYNAVYRRTKSSQGRKSSGAGINVKEETTSDSNDYGGDVKMELGISNSKIDSSCRARSMRTSRNEFTDSNNNFRVTQRNDSLGVSTSRGRSALNGCDQLIFDEWKSTSKMTVGLRSTRNRRENYNVTDFRPLDKRRNHQSIRKLSWLMLFEHEDSYRYIPQKGDEVAYLRQGHKEYIESSGTSEVGPWNFVKDLKAVEFCKVQDLDYSTLPGSGDSCCKLTLGFVDPSSSAFGKSFRITLPELDYFPDFLVERIRYDASIERNWTHRDKCQVWWRNADRDGGSWWGGRILAVKPKSSEFPDSPWERYVIQYKDDSSGQHLHSPWELHDANIQWEHPCIDNKTRNKLLSSIAKLEKTSITNEDCHGVCKLSQVAQKSDFLNRFPVPLSIEVIKKRLENNYYRTVDAVKHDASLMIANATSYFSKSAEMTTRMRRLSEWTMRTFSL
ncbi:WD domain, G-beta repeat domain containing protein [Musa troglodytarum]|uniref:WD domain, G-beta repeat domain containing protein n=1 Tax=Musa troglodytarum TaxID=320322 RepID=A0A9E7EV62_9LILI|nr:WD domain, G-beta repeat domain containing protein [Musa troglodytarum]